MPYGRRATRQGPGFRAARRSLSPAGVEGYWNTVRIRKNFVFDLMTDLEMLLPFRPIKRLFLNDCSQL